MPRVANPPNTTTGTGSRRIASSSSSRQLLSSPVKQSPMKIQSMAIQDDRIEKAARLKSRQAQREMEHNELRSAATASPLRRPAPQYRESGSPDTTPRSAADHARRKHTPAAQRHSSGTAGPGVMNMVVTPSKHRTVPVLANFEEWMKLATDNKINAANSWNFALIDYFHDLSLLKEGDGVNFQKASCTLDGCVKIYTSRVDSVSTEAGRLLSGLADGGGGEGKKSKKAEGEDGGEGEEDEDDDGEDGAGEKKKSKKRSARSHEATLAPSFASLQLKKLELEFAVDLLFKKASADFDEGGAKGLLLNHLSIDGEGRIVFDSSDDAGNVLKHGVEGGSKPTDDDATQYESEDFHDASQHTIRDEEEPAPEMEGDQEIDLDALANKFFPDLSVLDQQDICPSMKSFKLGDPSGDLSVPFLKPPEDWKSPQKRNEEQSQQPKIDLNLADATGIFLDGSNAAGFDDDDDGGIIGGFDVPDDVGFGEGGEAWAKEAAMGPMMQVINAEDVQSRDTGEDDDEDGGNGYALALSKGFQQDAQHASILQYFDKAFNSKKGRAAWSKGVAAQGATEYWRIAKIQMQQQSSAQNASEGASRRRERKEKEPFEVDFLGPMSDELRSLLEQPPATTAQITMPRAHWRTPGRNLLEVGEGEWVDSKQMGRLWLKPRCVIVKKGGKVSIEDRNVSQQGLADAEPTPTEDEGRKGDYDANFFADDDEGLPFDVPLPIDDEDDGLGVHDGDDHDSVDQVFTDAREMLSPPPSDANLNREAFPPISETQSQDPFSSQQMAPGSFGSQLVTGSQGIRKLRPEYVNYARVAKKVDVRRLKEELWKGMLEGFERVLVSSRDSTDGPPTPVDTEPEARVDVDVDADPDPDPDAMDTDPFVTGDQPPHDTKDEPSKTLKFTDMISDLRSVYPERQFKDISTSYCFICLLHLANEKGLVLEGGRSEDDLEGEGMRQIRVLRDQSLEVGYVGE